MMRAQRLLGYVTTCRSAPKSVRCTLRRRILAILLPRFRRFDSANLAIIFALSLVPITLAAGAGLDLSRGMLVRSQITSALDAASLAVGGTPGLSQSQMQTLAQQYFNANYKLDSSFGTPGPVTVTVTGQQVQVSASSSMPTTLMNVMGMSNFNVSGSSTVVWGQQKLWVSLVLDNTGSMTQTDGSGLSKISALKTATHNLLTMLQNAAASAGADRYKFRSFPSRATPRSERAFSPETICPGRIGALRRRLRHRVPSGRAQTVLTPTVAMASTAKPHQPTAAPMQTIFRAAEPIAAISVPPTILSAATTMAAGTARARATASTTIPGLLTPKAPGQDVSPIAPRATTP